MKFSRVAAMAVCGLLALVAASTASADELLVTNLIDGVNTLPIPGNQAWGGQLGDDFATTQPIAITSVAVFDDDGDGTVGDLFWQLFNVQTGALIHQETVSATGARTPVTTIEGNYVFQTLATPLVLAANQTYSVVAYGFDNTDKNFNTNFDLANLDVVFNSAGLTAAGGRYSTSGSDFSLLPTVGPSNVNAASDTAYNFGAASFEYTVVPTPSSLIALIGMGTVGLLAVVRRRRRKTV